MARERSTRRCTGYDEDESAVIGSWRDSGRTEKTILQYLYWVRRFRLYCRKTGRSERKHLTRDEVDEFARQYRGPRMRRRAPRRVTAPARTAMFAWSYALKVLGHPVPEWRIRPGPATGQPLIEEYVAFRKQHCGVAPATLIRDISTAEEFIAALRSARRSIARARISDIDRFVTQLGLRMSPRTVADSCSSLRAFLRFLHATGRLHHDLTRVVAAPRVRRVDHPPRMLPWSDVRRLLRAAQGESPTARRSYAVLLLMATYGLGAAEVVALQLEDVDWAAAELEVRRPKTGATTTLPLLSPVAKAIAVYLRKGRASQAATRAVFVSLTMPHRAMSTSAIRFLVRKYARAAGISVPVGGHMLRHSHATRQIDIGTNSKVVGDILGHRRPASTSVYIHVAWRRLRGVGLPVPT